MSSAIAERASAIRQHLSGHADQPLVRKYSFLAARFEEMKLQQIDGKTTPAEDAAFCEVTEMLTALTKRLGLGEAITGWRDFLPNDPQRILSASWLECARLWFTGRMEKAK